MNEGRIKILWVSRIVTAVMPGIAAFLALAIEVSAQCPMCKTGLMNSPEGRSMVDGFNSGILFLLSVPFLLVGTTAIAILRLRRRAESTRESGEEPE